MSTEAVAADKNLSEMKLLDPETLKCPYHYDQALREQAPVHQDPETGVYIVSTYGLVRRFHESNSGGRHVRGRGENRAAGAGAQSLGIEAPTRLRAPWRATMPSAPPRPRA